MVAFHYITLYNGIKKKKKQMCYPCGVTNPGKTGGGAISVKITTDDE